MAPDNPLYGSIRYERTVRGPFHDPAPDEPGSPSYVNAPGADALSVFPANTPLEVQVALLASLIMERFGGPSYGEGAIGEAMIIMTRQQQALRRVEARERETLDRLNQDDRIFEQMAAYLAQRHMNAIEPGTHVGAIVLRLLERADDRLKAMEAAVSQLHGDKLRLQENLAEAEAKQKATYAALCEAQRASPFDRTDREDGYEVYPTLTAEEGEVEADEYRHVTIDLGGGVVVSVSRGKVE